MKNLKTKGIFTVLFTLTIFFTMAFGNVFAANEVEKLYVQVNLTVKDPDGNAIPNGKIRNDLKPGDKLQLTAYCNNDVAKSWSQNPNFMQEKGYKYNNKGMAKIGYMFDSTDSKNYITTSDPTSAVITIPNFEPGSTHILRINAVAACDGLVENGKEYQATSGTFAIKLEIPKATAPETTITETITKVNDSTLKVTATVKNGTFDKIVYKWDNEATKESKSNPLNVTIPNFAPGSKHTLTATAYTTNGKSDTQNYTITMPDALTGLITVTYNGTTLSAGSTTTVSLGSKIIVACAPATNFSKVMGTWSYGSNGTGSFEFLAPAETIAIPGSEGQTIVLKVKGTLKDGGSVAEKTYTFKIPAAPVEILDGSVSASGLTPNGTVELPKGTVITLSGSPANNFLKVTYSWDDGEEKDFSGSSGKIVVPNFAPGTTHKLTVTGTLTDGKVVSKKIYYIKIPAEIQEEPEEPDKLSGNIEVELDGEKLVNNSTNTVIGDEEITIIGTPGENFKELIYRWDSGNWNTVEGNSIRMNVLAEEDVTHILRVYGVLKDNVKTTIRTYHFVIEEADDFIIEPWMREDKDAEGLLVSLRNDSEIEKANKNFYQLDEEIIYYVDYKNCGKEIDKEVKLVLQLPLKFDVVDSAAGTVSKSDKTITWTFENGLNEEQAGTKVVVVKYTNLSKSSYDYEIVYPEANIYKVSKLMDSSAVINYIYKSDSTEIEDEHEPYMFGDKEKPTFRPDDTISRAEGALVLTRIFGIKTSQTNITDKYSDIKDTYLEAQKAISAASNLGIIDGYADGTYRPNDKMTRAEFMKIIASYIEILGDEESVNGLEVKAGETIKIYKNSANRNHWSLPYVTLLVRLNMTSVSSSKKDLRLDAEITRAEVAQLVNFYSFRAPAKVTSSTKTDFVDVSRKHDLFSDIVEATRDSHTFVITEDGREREK